MQKIGHFYFGLTGRECLGEDDADSAEEQVGGALRGDYVPLSLATSPGHVPSPKSSLFSSLGAPSYGPGLTCSTLSRQVLDSRALAC